MRILSIDFDYFIDTDLDTRNNHFPDGSDNIDPEVLAKQWEDHYKAYPQLKDIGVIKSYNELVEHIRKGDYYLEDNKFIADSHGEIYNILKNIPEHESIEIVNVDFHHDYYHYFSHDNDLNCGNWVRKLYENRNDAKITWCKRSDSDIRTLDGQFPHTITDNITSLLDREYDIIFLCLSPEWTPPHLYELFHIL